MGKLPDIFASKGKVCKSILLISLRALILYDPKPDSRTTFNSWEYIVTERLIRINVITIIKAILIRTNYLEI
jgi:hypothetical protein